MKKYLAKFWRNDGGWHGGSEAVRNADGDFEEGMYSLTPMFVFQAADDKTAKKLAIGYARKREQNLKEDCWLRQLWRLENGRKTNIRVGKKERFDKSEDTINSEMQEMIKRAGFREVTGENAVGLLI